jgi:hypothetical protein
MADDGDESEKYEEINRKRNITLDTPRSFPFRSRNLFFPESAVTGIPETEPSITWVEIPGNICEIQQKQIKLKRNIYSSLC